MSVITAPTIDSLIGTQKPLQQRKYNFIAHCIRPSKRADEINGRPLIIAGKDEIRVGTWGTGSHRVAAYFLPYPGKEYDSLVTTTSPDNVSNLNWIYVDADTHQLKYGPHKDTEENIPGPFDTSSPTHCLTFDGWEGFCAVELRPDTWTIYFDIKDDGLKAKVPPGTRVLEIRLERRKRRAEENLALVIPPTVVLKTPPKDAKQKLKQGVIRTPSKEKDKYAEHTEISVVRRQIQRIENRSEEEITFSIPSPLLDDTLFTSVMRVEESENETRGPSDEDEVFDAPEADVVTIASASPKPDAEVRGKPDDDNGVSSTGPSLDAEIEEKLRGDSFTPPTQLSPQIPGTNVVKAPEDDAITPTNEVPSPEINTETGERPEADVIMPPRKSPLRKPDEEAGDHSKHDVVPTLEPSPFSNVPSTPIWDPIVGLRSKFSTDTPESPAHDITSQVPSPIASSPLIPEEGLAFGPMLPSRPKIPERRTPDDQVSHDSASSIALIHSPTIYQGTPRRRRANRPMTSIAYRSSRITLDPEEMSAIENLSRSMEFSRPLSLSLDVYVDVWGAEEKKGSLIRRLSHKVTDRNRRMYRSVRHAGSRVLGKRLRIGGRSTNKRETSQQHLGSTGHDRRHSAWV